ncbi:nucleotide exchange factor GrpE [Candidatus Nomurabacteria bacterium]|nr:nucleotide exchange factor GrpE [Candidatus Nomurabacteria bacterium]
MKKPHDTEEYSNEDEIVYDDSTTVTDKVKKLKEKIKELESSKQEYLDGWQRSKADFVNLKKRLEEDKKSFVKFANEGLITDLLSTLDSFDMAFKNKESWESVSENWRKGIEYIYTNLLRTLEDYGVRQIIPIGEEFDPLIHESVAEVEGEDGKIVEVTLNGYSLNDKIIRAPQVKVGKKT